MRLFYFITFLPFLALFVNADDKCPVSFGKNNLFQNTALFKLFTSEGRKKILTGMFDQVIVNTHLGECDQCKFHLFSVPGGVIVVRCFEDKQGSLDCGYVHFKISDMKVGRGYDGKSWNYNPFELTSSQIDTDKIFLRIFNNSTIWRMYFDYNQRADIPTEGRTTGIKVEKTDADDLIVIATCFDKGYKCVPDYSPYYKTRKAGYPIRRTSRKDAVVAFHRMLFYKLALFFDFIY
uniref:Uncharacterized protein n=1 Tax=Panagrolaimus sp. JU765 TaxID=591449 RepID=A0AC34RP61_9BILA